MEATFIVPVGNATLFEEAVILVVAVVVEATLIVEVGRDTPFDPAAIVVFIVVTKGEAPVPILDVIPPVTVPVPPEHPVKLVAVVPVYVINCLPVLETTSNVPLLGNPVVEFTSNVVCGNVTRELTVLAPVIAPVPPVQPKNCVALVLVYVTVCVPLLDTTKIVPDEGNPEVELTLIVVCGRVTFTVTKVAPPKTVPLLKSTTYEFVAVSKPVIRKQPELYCGFVVLFTTMILPVSADPKVVRFLVATGIEILNSLPDPKLIPALVPPANVGVAAVGVESAVEISMVPTAFIG